MPLARLSPTHRRALLGAGVLLLALAWVALPAAHATLGWFAPIVALGLLMLAGVRPDELVERLVRRAARSRGPLRPARALGSARRTAGRPLASGLLIALSLATRPPPAAPASAA